MHGGRRLLRSTCEQPLLGRHFDTRATSPAKGVTVNQVVTALDAEPCSCWCGPCACQVVACVDEVQARRRGSVVLDAAPRRSEHMLLLSKWQGAGLRRRRRDPRSIAGARARDGRSHRPSRSDGDPSAARASSSLRTPDATRTPSRLPCCRFGGGRGDAGRSPASGVAGATCRQRGAGAAAPSGRRDGCPGDSASPSRERVRGDLLLAIEPIGAYAPIGR